MTSDGHPHITGRIQAVAGVLALAVFCAISIVVVDKYPPPPKPWLAFAPGNHYSWTAVDTNGTKVASGTWGKKVHKKRYEHRSWVVLGDDGLIYQVEEIRNSEEPE